MKMGDIAFSHPKELGFYPKAVRYFTKSRWSHCFYLAPEYMGELMVIETDLKVQAVPFVKEYVQKGADVFEIYSPRLATSRARMAACKTSFMLAAGQTYGFLSIPWFALRSILKFFGIHLKKNFSSDGIICSELLLLYIACLGEDYAAAVKHLSINETSPQDIFDVILSRPDLFERVQLDA